MTTLAKYNSEENLRCLNNSYRQEEKTPTKRSKTPKKTPKVASSPSCHIPITNNCYPQGDRFIPAHDLDVELNHYNLTKENTDPNVEITTDNQFNSALENTLFEGKAQSKVMHRTKHLFYDDTLLTQLTLSLHDEQYSHDGLLILLTLIFYIKTLFPFFIIINSYLDLDIQGQSSRPQKSSPELVPLLVQCQF